MLGLTPQSDLTRSWVPQTDHCPGACLWRTVLAVGHWDHGAGMTRPQVSPRTLDCTQKTCRMSGADTSLLGMARSQQRCEQSQLPEVEPGFGFILHLLRRGRGAWGLGLNPEAHILTLGVTLGAGQRTSRREPLPNEVAPAQETPGPEPTHCRPTQP